MWNLTALCSWEEGPKLHSFVIKSPLAAEVTTKTFKVSFTLGKVDMPVLHLPRATMEDTLQLQKDFSRSQDIPSAIRGRML